MRIVTLLIIYVALAFPLFAQQQQPTRAELEARRKEILEAIKETQQQLDATKKDKKASMGQLHALQNKLAERQRLISNINDEIGDISDNIQTSTNEVARLRNNLQVLKIRYAQSVRYAYEARSSYDMLAFIFSSSDFNDAVRRMRYLRKFRDYRKEQADEIRSTQSQIERKIGVLNSQKEQKDQLLGSQVQQQQELEKEKDEKNQVVNELKGREKELVVSIEKNRKAAKRLDRAISEIIRHEIEVARKKAEEERRKAAALAAANAAANKGSNIRVTTTTIPNVPSSSSGSKSNAAPSYSLSLTPEVAALSNNFAADKGKLPWPVEKGFISESFGRHAHPIAEKVMVENDGLEIQTSAGATARAIFDGTVNKIFYVPGMGQCVMINHGQFFSVYSRLESVTVHDGEKVHTKQPIGTVMANDEGSPTIHFELWKVGSNNVASPIDPATWIAQ